MLFGLILGLAGAVCVILEQSIGDLGSIIGMIATLGALVGMSAAMLYEKRFGVAHHPVSANLVQYPVGLGAILPLASMLETMVVDWTFEFTAALAYLVIGNSLISITLLLAMIRRGETAAVSVHLFLVPPLAALIAWLVIDETLTILAGAGMVIAAVGVAIVVNPTRKQA